MKSGIIRMTAAVVVSQIVLGISAAHAFDDDFMKLQQERFRLERQLQQQDFRLRQQQARLDRQLSNQQFKMQQQLMKNQFNQPRQFSDTMRLQQFPLEQYHRSPQISPTSWQRDYQATFVRTDWLNQRSITTPLPFSLGAMIPSRLAYNASGLSSGFMPVWFNKPAVGMTSEAATYALSSMRGEGGHAMRHWVEGGLIPDKYSLAIRRESFFRPGAQAILEDPLMTFETKLGSTRATGYLGRGVGGKWDSYQAVFVAGEGAYKGRVMSAYSDLPLNQQVRWRISKWDSLDGLSARTASQLRAVQGAFTILDAASTAAQTFVQTMDYVGKSMQMMNPPTYLQNNPRFTPSQTLLGIPITATREGSGTYSIPWGSAGYHEILSTEGPGPITRVHTEWARTEYGSYYRTEEVRTPSASWLERFMVTHYPVGSYWDENSTVSYTRQGSSYSWRETNIGGVRTITPIRSFDTNRSFGTINNYAGYSPGFNNLGSSYKLNTGLSSYGNNYQIYQQDFKNITSSRPTLNSNFGN